MALVRTPSSARQPPVRRTSRNSYSHRVGAIAPTSVMQLSKPSWRLMMHASSAVRTRGIAHGRALPVHQLLDAEQIAVLHAHRRTMIEPIDQGMAWTDFGFDELLDAPLNQPDIRPLANTAPKSRSTFCSARCRGPQPIASSERQGPVRERLAARERWLDRFAVRDAA